MNSGKKFNFGYSWVWTYGHLVPTALFAGGAAAAGALGAPTWVIVALAAAGLWFFTGFCIARFLIDMNAPMGLPPEVFFAEDSTGKVLDLGCGSGRTSIMVGLARPNVSITALDNFSADYIDGHGKDNTIRNFEVAGIAERVRIEEGDMRCLPFDANSFDAAVSSFAIDHLDEKDIHTTLAEVNRVLIPEGEFLLMVIVPNIWLWLTYGVFMGWGGFPRRSFWRRVLRSSGFSTLSEGSSRGCAFFHIQKTAAPMEVPASLSNSPSRGKHEFSVRGMVLPTAATGLLFFIGALTLRALGLEVSWWWVALSVPIGLHVGPLLVILAGAFRWFSRTRA